MLTTAGVTRFARLSITRSVFCITAIASGRPASPAGAFAVVDAAGLGLAGEAVTAGAANAGAAADSAIIAIQIVRILGSMEAPLLRSAGSTGNRGIGGGRDALQREARGTPPDCAPLRHHARGSPPRATAPGRRGGGSDPLCPCPRARGPRAAAAATPKARRRPPACRPRDPRPCRGGAGR